MDHSSEHLHLGGVNGNFHRTAVRIVQEVPFGVWVELVLVTLRVNPVVTFRAFR